MDKFKLFMRCIAADARLSRAIPKNLLEKSPEEIVLGLAIALADAREGRMQHPAHLLLEELDGAR